MSKEEKDYLIKHLSILLNVALLLCVITGVHFFELLYVIICSIFIGLFYFLFVILTDYVKQFLEGRKK